VLRRNLSPFITQPGANPEDSRPRHRMPGATAKRRSAASRAPRQWFCPVF